MKKIIAYLFLSYLIIFLTGCREKRQEPGYHDRQLKSAYDSLAGNLIADTIIYDVIIKNPNPDDIWTEQCLGYFRRDEFVSQLFKAVYDERAEAYDFITGKKMSPRDLRKFEKTEDFGRDKIGKIQFAEVWYFDADKLTMDKRILYMILGYEVMGDNSEIIGYKPVFRIYLN
jgi:hypothetical protein